MGDTPQRYVFERRRTSPKPRPNSPSIPIGATPSAVEIDLDDVHACFLETDRRLRAVGSARLRAAGLAVCTSASVAAALLDLDQRKRKGVGEPHLFLVGRCDGAEAEIATLCAGLQRCSVLRFLGDGDEARAKHRAPNPSVAFDGEVDANEDAETIRAEMKQLLMRQKNVALSLNETRLERLAVERRLNPPQRLDVTDVVKLYADKPLHP